MTHYTADYTPSPLTLLPTRIYKICCAKNGLVSLPLAG